MSNPNRFSRTLGLLSLLVLVSAGLADDPPKDEPRAAVAKCVTATGTLLDRPGAGKKWQAVKQGDSMQSGDLLVGLPGAAIDAKNGAVRVTLFSVLEKQTQPVLESAIVVHQSDGFDLDFTLDRGRVDLVNRKDKGAAKVKLRFRDQVWELTLAEPGSRVGLELFGRWAPGVFFNKDKKPQPVPESGLVVLGVSGQAEVKHGLKVNALPASSMLTWDSIGGPGPGPAALPKLPAWADPQAKPSELGKENQAAVKALQERLAGKPVDAALAESLSSSEAASRRVALVALGAVNDLPHLFDALNDAKRADVRDSAVEVLRNWVARGSGQDLQLYEFLVTEKKYPPGRARMLVDLLHTFGEGEVGRPETWETLIDYLKHDSLAVRELARWQLTQLVPKIAREIPYNAAGSKDELEAAFKKWKKEVPDGKLPR